ncbi:MAG: peptidyl-tRNA hydrolase Pth2 [Candidatus Methanomethylophilaceae archaeon]|jgi:PTH2 family peptidyl-tRNA hydrolase|nr:peptidyl-tRNA hydrolase Pth2 [Candidatus Methanomethylophilaceae archaeon]
MSSFEYKMVIAVRNDLKLSKGKTAAQVAHAAVNCAFASKKKSPKWFDSWYGEGQKKVVVKLDGKEALFEVKSRADAAGVVNSVITDAGHTEVPAGTITCIGIGPAPEDVLEKITGDLKLM